MRFQSSCWPGLHSHLKVQLGKDWHDRLSEFLQHSSWLPPEQVLSERAPNGNGSVVITKSQKWYTITSAIFWWPHRATLVKYERELCKELWVPGSRNYWGSFWKVATIAAILKTACWANWLFWSYLVHHIPCSTLSFLVHRHWHHKVL